MTRTLLFASLVASTSFAEAISGTFSSTFQGFDKPGQPTVRLSLQLICQLTPCPATRPQLHFSAAGGTHATFLSAPKETVGYVSAFFGTNETGSTVLESTQFPAGSAFKVVVTSATCWCGNATGEGGYIDLIADTFIPPWITVGVRGPKVGEDWLVMLSARPQGAEVVKLTLSGAGFNGDVFTLGAADFDSSGAGAKSIRPTRSGPLTITASLMPYDVSYTTTVMVEGAAPGNVETADGGTAEVERPSPPPGGCAVTPGALGLLSLLWLIQRRRSP